MRADRVSLSVQRLSNYDATLRTPPLNNWTYAQECRTLAHAEFSIALIPTPIGESHVRLVDQLRNVDGARHPHGLGDRPGYR